MCSNAHIELDGWTKGDTPLRSERSPAELALEFGDIQAVLGQGEGAIGVLQADWNICRGHGGIDHIDGSGEIGAARCAVRIDVEFDLARSAQVGIEELGQMKVDRAEKQHRHGCIAGGGNGALEFKIRCRCP